METVKLIDIHCHAGGIGAGKSGCFISDKLKRSVKFRAYLRALNLTLTDIEKAGDDLAASRVSQMLRTSKRVGKAVFMALDGVVDPAGNLDGAKTEVYIPNDFVAAAAKRHDNLLFGASVNPMRGGALERLLESAEEGAVLIKWLPNIQRIDPADERHIPFYLAMKKARLPLLVHTGHERSFTSYDDKFGDPERLRLPLSLGLTVIACHCGGHGSYMAEKSAARFLKMCACFPNLYGDISATTQLRSPGGFVRLTHDPLLKGRLLYGSDMPLVNTLAASPFLFAHKLSPKNLLRISKIENPWDRDIELKKALGFSLDNLADPLAILRLRGERKLFIKSLGRRRIFCRNVVFHKTPLLERGLGLA